MNKLAISQRLKYLMADKEIRVTDLARETKLPQPTVHRIVTGISPNPHSRSLKPIADFFGITLDQLKGKKPISWLNIKGLLKSQMTTTKEVPLLPWDDACHWQQKLTSHDYTSVVTTDVNISHHGFALIIPDNSMDPVFPINTILIIDPEREMEDKKYVLVRLKEANELLFRQLSIDGKQYYLKPLNINEEKYTIKLFTSADQYIGTLVQIKRNF